MNGEILLSCKIAAAAKLALKEKELIHCEHSKYEHSITFDFLPHRTFLTTKTYKASNINEWYEKCLSQGLFDIKFLMPLSVEDRGLLGFSNSSQNSLVCFYKNEKVTYFTAHWEFDNTIKLWNIRYTEQSWKNPPQDKPQFEDNTEKFAEILKEIEIFAREIECIEFADIFHNAKVILKDGHKTSSENSILLPSKNYNLFMAASTADVFGAMGSWNDSPRYMAHEKGLEPKYDELSTELLKQLRLAVLYAINQW
ncbi:MAG: Uncharacterized protein K0R92_2770 [Lachnospiraceae bacterium]|jgi:WD40 repeat protein|nr:Uncharacterized protein [Lachnospiraceae bacterium]